MWRTLFDKRVAAITISSFIVCVVAGILFVAAMELSDFHRGESVLIVASGAFLLLSILVGFLKLHVIAPMAVLVPFCFAVLVRHVGDMGEQHHIDGGIFFLSVLVFCLCWGIAATTKVVLAIRRSRKQPSLNIARYTERSFHGFDIDFDQGV